jgi:hypothetical protein
MSWRLWNRETFCCEPQPQLATTPAIAVNAPRPTSRDVPDLSASVESVASDESDRIERHRKPALSAPLDFKRPATSNCDSALSRSRGREKHITSLGLEKMVYSIKEKKDLKDWEPLSPSIASYVQPLADITPRPLSPSPIAPQQQHKYSTESCATTAESNSSETAPVAGSDTSVSSRELAHSHSVIRGFSPGHASSSYRSQSNLAPTPAPSKSILHQKSEAAKKKTGMFTLGGSSGDDESSFEERMSFRPKHSSLSEGLTHDHLHAKKQTSFREEVESRQFKTIKEGTHEDDDAIESDDDEEEEEVSESAIEDDDDESDWEDSVTESGRSSVDEKQLFQRVDSRPNLTSRRSLLTTALHEPQRAAALTAAASRSTPALHRSRTSSPNGPSVAGSPEDDEPSALTMRGPNIPRSKPIIMTTSNTHPPAHSPRTTRRNMLQTELTESLRKHLLWERQQKSTTANAVFKRRHTAIDVSKLQDYPGAKVGQTSKDASKNNSWNHYFDIGPWEYHVKGW